MIKNKEVASDKVAEIAMLSCICHAPADIQKEMLEFVTLEHFYSAEHKKVFQAILRVIGTGVKADWIGVMGELESTNELKMVGGQEKMAEIASYCPSHSDWKRYYPKLEDTRYRRQMEYIGGEMIARSRDKEIPLDELKNWSETTVMKADFAINNEDRLSIKSAAIAAIDNIEAMLAGRPNRGISTGLPQLDEILLFGMRGGDMITIAARPSVGKSALAMQIAEHIAIDLKKRALIFTLEMSTISLMERMIRSRARVPLSNLLGKNITEQENQAIARATSEIVNSNLLCDDNAGRSINYIKQVARRANQEQKLDIIIIDYLQLVKGASKRSKENRTCEIEEVSNSIKELAKNLNVPVVALAQLNRDPEKRKEGHPTLADLKGSGSIEQDSDIVALIHRIEKKNKFENPDMEIIIAKHRNGPIGVAKAVFNRAITRFE